MNNQLIWVAGLFSVMMVFTGNGKISAYQIENLPNTEIAGDIVLGPGKIEAVLNPGESAERTLYFTNRTGRKVDFRVNVEDFRGSRNANEGTIFMGGQKGPYSLKDYFRPDVWEFTLEQGQRISLPVKIEIPVDAEPGGLYGAVFATALPPDYKESAPQENTKPVVGIASRVGALFFVKINGDLKEEGRLKDFFSFAGKNFFEQGPITFQFTYENNGNVHLVPYGVIEITNMMGRKTGQVAIEPYFAMPDAERLNEAKWDNERLFGRYTAVLSLNRGYGDIIDTKSVSFWVVPWKLMVAGLAVSVVFAWLAVWIFSHFEFRKKESR